MAKKWKFVARPTCWWPITFNVPVDGGEVEKVEFEMRYVRATETEFEERFVRGIGAAIAALGPDATDEQKVAAAKAHDRKLFDDFVKGWRGFEAENDSEPPAFTGENIDAMFEQPGFASAFGTSYARFWAAVPEEREKNSGASPAGGLATEALTSATTASGDATSSVPSASGAPTTST